MLMVSSFQGYVIGNPGTGEWFDSGFFVQFAHGMGIISDQLYQVFYFMQTNLKFGCMSS